MALPQLIPNYLRGYRFRPTLIPTLAAIVGLMLTVYLGQWQQGRAAEKRALQQSFGTRMSETPITLAADLRDPQADRFRRAVATGEYDAAGQLFIDNKFSGSNVGYDVFTPLRLINTNTWVLVNRGWVARSKQYPQVPLVVVPVGEVSVRGLLTTPTSKFLELADRVVEGGVWQNLTVERYRMQTNRRTQPLVLLAQSADDAHLILNLEQPDARVEKHVEYMLTWYALAITIFVLWIGLNLNISKKETES